MPWAESDISDFDDDELLDELRERGVPVNITDTDAMIALLEDDGYIVQQGDVIPVAILEDIERLYLDYQLTSKEFFEKQLKQFLSRYLNKHII